MILSPFYPTWNLHWLVVWNMNFIFPPWVGTMIQSGEFIFVRGVETTNQLYYGIGHLLILGDLLSHYIFMISSSLVLNSPWNIWNRTCRMFCGLMFSSPEWQVPLILSHLVPWRAPRWIPLLWAKMRSNGTWMSWMELFLHMFGIVWTYSSYTSHEIWIIYGISLLITRWCLFWARHREVWTGSLGTLTLIRGM